MPLGLVAFGASRAGSSERVGGMAPVAACFVRSTASAHGSEHRCVTAHTRFGLFFCQMRVVASDAAFSMSVACVQRVALTTGDFAWIALGVDISRVRRVTAYAVGVGLGIPGSDLGGFVVVASCAVFGRGLEFVGLMAGGAPRMAVCSGGECPGNGGGLVAAAAGVADFSTNAMGAVAGSATAVRGGVLRRELSDACSSG